MPVSQTAKRALRSSKRKMEVSQLLVTQLEVALRVAKKEKSVKAIKSAISWVDKAAKKKLIHKNKASRIKSQLSRLGKSKASQKTEKNQPAKKGKASKNRSAKK